MITAITYGNKKFEKAKKYNLKTARRYGADCVIGYSDEDIDSKFYKKNKRILCRERGNGYWLWKPYFINKALENVNFGDYLIYTDAGCSYVNNISYLIECMEKNNVDIMPFSLGKYFECQYTKRDVFNELNMDNLETINSPQNLAGYVLVKKTEHSVKFIKDWLKFCQVDELITDDPSKLPNYEGFKENRHDQSVYSVLVKKYNLLSFRDPSQYGIHRIDSYSKEVLERSNYPQVIDSHRYAKASSKFIIKLRRVCLWGYRCLKNKKIEDYNEQFR